jgi:hypothetical protein
MSAPGKTSQDQRKKNRTRKPPPRWRRYLVQAELDLPPPAHGTGGDPTGDGVSFADDPEPLPWYQARAVVFGLVAACLVLAVLTVTALWNGARDREAARAAEAQARTLTLRAVNSERTLRIAPNPRSWSASADARIAWPDPPQLLEIYLPVGYAPYGSYALVVDKVDHGRVMVIERMAPDSNKDLRLALNSSAFGPGEYRIRLQGYTWRGQRVDAGWVRLVVD